LDFQIELWYRYLDTFGNFFKWPIFKSNFLVTLPPSSQNGDFITFKSCKSEVFSSPALDELHAVDDDGPSQDVSQAEDMKLLQRSSGL
jgi:hypothetical protein